MSGGLNAEFISSPEDFLGKYFLRVGAQRFQGSGVKRFDLAKIGGVDVSLTTREKWGGTRLIGYFLKAVENKKAICTSHDLTEVDYFFTDTLTGCQFLAYGSTLTPIIEHNNNKNGKGPDYTFCRQAAQLANGWYVSVDNADYQATDPKTGNVKQMANVVGVRRNGHWQFIMQRMAAGGLRR